MLAKIHNISKRFGRTQALEGASVDIPAGATGLLGPNGAGKTTLLKILLGLLKPDSGSVEILGLDLSRDVLEIRRRVGFMPELDCYVPGLSGVGMVAYLGRLTGMPAREAFSRAHEVLDFTGLFEARYRKVKTYSMGMRQRVKFAAALVHDPEIVFLDEATSGLDPEGRAEMLKLIGQLAAMPDKSVVLSTHLLNDVEKTCRSVIILNRGRVLRQGTLDELLQSKDGSFIIGVKDRGAELAKALEGAGFQGTCVDTGELLVSGGGPEPAGVFKCAAKCGISIRRFEPQRFTLEDIFLQFIKKDSEKPDADIRD